MGKHAGLNGPVVYRGNHLAKKMIIGEAPGKDEDEQGQPFVGPAGQLLDKIFASVGWDTDTDWYLGNVVKCRPIPPAGSWKQNFTPTPVHREKCWPYIKREIDFLKPNIVVLLGNSAANTFYPMYRHEPMHAKVGKILMHSYWPNTGFFVMYHPAYMLHASGTERYQKIRLTMWKHIQMLKQLVEEFENEQQ